MPEFQGDIDPSVQNQAFTSKTSKVSRREFFKAIGGAAAFLTTGKETAEARPQNYRTGPLAGKKFNDLYSEYTGIKGEVPEAVTIDFNRQLNNLWEKKVRRSGNNPVVVKTRNEVLAEYNRTGPVKTDLSKYSAEIGRVISSLNSTLDWKAYAQKKGLSAQEVNLLQQLSYSIKGKDLAAYAMTELMPSKDGRLNRDVMNFLLSNAGKNYVETIPAIYDKKTSFGPYQFTEYALYEVDGVRRGASIPNQFLRSGKIRDSVAMLRGTDHHKAAYLFVVDNLANLVNRSTKKQLNALTRVLREKHDDLVAYAATAHHGPGAAMKIAKRWLDNNAQLPYEVSCGRIYRLYAEKTKANLGALKNF